MDAKGLDYVQQAWTNYFLHRYKNIWSSWQLL